MTGLYKILFFFIPIIFYTNSLHAQYLNGNGNNGKVEADFLFDKIETEAKSSVFNILKITNKNSTPFKGNVQFALPQDWNIIGSDKVPIEIPANDSLKIPVRVSVSKDALGEIGYSVVATVTNGNTSRYTAYFYITIPRSTAFTVDNITSIKYVSSDAKEVKLDYSLYNNGNIDELVHLEVTTTDNIIIEDNPANIPFVKEYSIPAYSDTIIKLDLSLADAKKDKNFSKVQFQSSSLDTIYNQTLWLKFLDNNYKLTIPEYHKCAILELTAHNIFSNTKPSYSMLLKGWVLLKNEQDISYYYRNYNIANSEYLNGINNEHVKAYIGYRNRYTDIRVGTIERNMQQALYGTGANAKLFYKRYSLEGVYIDDALRNYSGYGGNVSVRLKRTKLLVGAIQADYRNTLFKTNLGYLGTSFKIKSNYFNILGGISNAAEQGGTAQSYDGFGVELRYKLSTKKVQSNIQAKYGSRYYTGIYGGRFFINANFQFRLSSISSIDASYRKQDYNNVFHYLTVTTSDHFNKYDDYRVFYSRFLSSRLNFQVGGIVKNEGTNQLYATGQVFETIDSRLFAAGQYKTGISDISVSPRFDIGQVNILRSDDNNLFEDRKNFGTFNFSLNINSSNYGLYSIFRYGPYNIYEHYYYYTSEYFSKWFFLMPYYQKYFFNKTLKLDIRGNYINNITGNENSFTLNTQLNWYLPRDFTIRLLNSATLRTRTDPLNNRTYKYNSLYFEIGIRKEFNCNQPRVKYYDLKVVFFRDLDGDREKDKNEPGIPNVFASISRDHKVENKESTKGFIDAELLSDQYGEVAYTNMPNGFYTIDYRLLGDIVGNYSLEELEKDIEMDKDKVVYIPYLENNKIFGKVILNRDPLSSLGPLDINNIRIIAEDTKGNTYSALTDKTGYFVLYTPKADHYIVKINNIFYENFDLQQNEFIVKFNGYKQFEVTFVFNEKKRKINFSEDVTGDEELELDDFQVIRKTTLAGKIIDAISLEPIEAEISIVDNNTNQVVANAKSNRLNGNYSISYVAGDHFRIEVKAADHWDHVENLYIEQVISIQNIAKDIMLNKTSEGPKKQTFIIYDEKEEDDFTENFKSGQKIPINYLNFNEKDTRVSPNVYPELDRLIDLLNKNKTVRIEVAGHAHDTGKERIDNMLALRRARAVAKYLTSHGLSEDRIIIKSYSNKRPLVPGTSEAAKQKNRRVEIIVL